jgi:hypothetical protein
MCEVATLTAIAVGTTVAGTAMKAGAAHAQGEAARFAAGINAAEANRQAADAIARSRLPGARVRARGGQVVAAQESAYSAAGVVVGTGSAADVEADTRIITDQEEEVVRNNAAREARGYQAKAQAFLQQGEYARSAAENAVAESIVGGVGSLAQIGVKGWLDRPPRPTVPGTEGVVPSYEDYARISD